MPTGSSADSAMGLDMGGTTVAGGLVASDGQVLSHLHAATHARGHGTALATIVEICESLGERAAALGLRLTGVGIGVPGTVDAECGVIGADIHYVPELAGINLAALIGERLRLPVFVDNDVNVLALGEGEFGAGRGARALVMLALGTGVGGGLIPAGRLHPGPAGFGAWAGPRP